MIKVLIFSGGTGSTQLQTGLWKLFGESLDIKVLINMYDNGMSTGVVRRVIGGKILGPSDLRKNQMLAHHLRYGSSKLSKILDERFTTTTKEAHAYVRSKLDDVEDVTSRLLMQSAVDEYFGWPSANLVDYTDFAIANIVYAGIMAQNNFSATKCATVMSKILKIPDNVLINSDENLYLHANTASGKIIFDEGDIVDWKNPDDKIDSIFLASSEKSKSAVQPSAPHHVLDAIQSADLIIYSAGTFWSSLAPTYVTSGISTALMQSSCPKILVMNNRTDKDMWGVSAEEMVETMSRLIPMEHNNTTVLLNSNSAVPAELTKVKAGGGMSVVSQDMGNDKTHHPTSLARACLNIFYNSKCDGVLRSSNVVVTDYDDTLVARGNEDKVVSNSNVKLMHTIAALQPFYVCTGNSIKSINIEPNFDLDTSTRVAHRKIGVYADGGLNRYIYASFTNDITFDGAVNPDCMFTSTEVQAIEAALTDLGINSSKIENRNFGIISIKPVDPEYRAVIANAIRMKFLLSLQENYVVAVTGRTTIDIYKSISSKQYAIEDILKTRKDQIIVYLGDEIDGNDKAVLEMSKANDMLRFIYVRDVHETNVFLKMFCLNQGVLTQRAFE